MKTYALTGETMSVLAGDDFCWVDIDPARLLANPDNTINLTPVVAYAVLRRLLWLLDESSEEERAGATEADTAPMQPLMVQRGDEWFANIIVNGNDGMTLLFTLPGTRGATFWVEAIGRCASAVAHAFKHGSGPGTEVKCVGDLSLSLLELRDGQFVPSPLR